MPVTVISNIGITRLNSIKDWPRLLPARRLLLTDAILTAVSEVVIG
jgi:hypothetical protein